MLSIVQLRRPNALNIFLAMDILQVDYQLDFNQPEA